MKNNNKRFFFSKVNISNFIAYAIHKGDCTLDLNGLSWSTVYMIDKGQNYVPQPGDQLYVDQLLTIPLNTIAINYRMGIIVGGGGGAILIYDSVFEFDTLGKILTVTPCIIQGGDAGSIVGETHTSCYACMTVTVSVPSGTKNVVITKLGNAGYSGNIITACTSGVQIIQDLNENITADRTYSFGIDAAVGNGSETTTISLQVDAETPIVLTHTHQFPIVNC